MTVSARDRANAQQLIASDPTVSAFVAASAGSGKTKLLTDRLLRLMLAGANPARIQCLTFTKAAAAEMALRLQRRLGRWVTLDDAQLDRDLEAIGVAATDDSRNIARALFAHVLDLPGGMRIGTIHAFCQSLLRRFPLEAQLSPHFNLADDQDSAIAWQDAREAMLSQAHTPTRRAALEKLAALASLSDFGHLVETLQRDRDRLEKVGERDPASVLQTLRRVLGATTPGDLGANVTWAEEADLLRLFRTLGQRGSAKVAEKAQRITAWLGLPAEHRAENWSHWREEFFSASGPRAMGAFINPKLLPDLPETETLVASEQSRIAAIEDGWSAAEVADISAALLDLALPVTRAYASTKTLTGKLDYDDLITRTARLLLNPGAAWVLYKLDGGLDHLLLDEVQDTAPQQWEIAGSLTSEFFAGVGAQSDTNSSLTRTVFAVGDRKQSIYGFQGADPDAFEHWRTVLRHRVESSGAQWRDVALDVSFRSTAPVLALVDAVFAQPEAASGVTDGAPLHHIADRAQHAGRVELWPVTPKPDPAATDPWATPTENLRQSSAMQRLADGVAEWIAGQIDRKVPLESQNRPIGAGDILVLVRRRNAFAPALVSALKSRNVAVAGLDRMVLTAQPAVADLLALCDTLLLPEDDLQLACVLTSPLGGLTDDQLMTLAAPRPRGLWQALQSATAREYTAAAAFIRTLLSRVDHTSPHALLTEALGPLGGRARLLARLGPEAAEPIDELLAAALRHAQTHPPSLQGFLHWLRQSAAEVKREPEGPGGDGFDAVRIMTVHGAKGLQAPLVILPDTTGLPPDDETIVWAADPDGNAGHSIPIWTPRKERRCAAAEALRADLRARQSREQNRLLYVALTRAEDRLLVCGWATRDVPDTSWYAHIRRGFQALDIPAVTFDAIETPWEGDFYATETPQIADSILPKATTREAASPLPHWAGRAPLWHPAPPPPEPALPSPLAPSRPDNAGLGDVPQAASPLASRDPGGSRFRRGQLVHSLLQHLPDLPPGDRFTAAAHFAARPGHDIADPDSLAAEVMAVLDHPALAPLFTPHGRAEVPLSGVVAGQVIGGLIDRLAVLPDRVLLADYKTNRIPPHTPEATPVLYLRQLAAYRAVLTEIFPDRPVECLLIWTVGCRVMTLPASLLDGHAPTATHAA